MAKRTVYTLVEAAEELRVCTRTLRRYIQQGMINITRYTERGKIYITHSELQRYLSKQTQATAVSDYRNDLLSQLLAE